MEILYFVGCYYSYDPRIQKVAAATAKILQKAGVDFGILGSEESCCGESIRKAGNEEAFKTLARENIKAFIDHGVKRILVSSPHCYHTFKNEYSEFMVNLEVVHITQYLRELIDAGRLELDGEFAKRVTYHDPCYLGRHNGIYDQPRDVLKSCPGWSWWRCPTRAQNSLCCGGGGGRIWMDTPKERAVRRPPAGAGAGGRRRGAGHLLPLLHQQLRGEPAGPRTRMTPLQIKDITESSWKRSREAKQTHELPPRAASAT